MELAQSAFIIAILSLPVVIFLGLTRSALCIYRCRKAGHLKFTIFSFLAMVILLAIFAAVFVVWFAYAVAHTGKDASTDLVILASTGTLVYLGAFCTWRASVYMEKRLDDDNA